MFNRLYTDNIEIFLSENKMPKLLIFGMDITYWNSPKFIRIVVLWLYGLILEIIDLPEGNGLTS